MAEGRSAVWRAVVLTAVGMLGAALLVAMVFLASSRQDGETASAEGTVVSAPAAGTRIPTQVEYHDGLAFFDPVTGESAIWYHKRPDGAYDLFDAPGFHPNYGREAPLQAVTPLIAGDIRLSFDRPVSAPTQARRVAPRPATQGTVPRGPAVQEQVVSIPAPVPQAPLVRSIIIPAGTRLDVVLDRQLSTETNRVGDTFPVSLSRGVVIDGQTVLEQGFRLTGEITALERPGRVSGVARMTLVLKVLSDSETAIATAPLTMEGEATKGRDAVSVGIGAGAGAALGGLLGGKKGAATGTAIGGGAGAGQVLATRGADLVLPPEKILTFMLSRNAEIQK